ncbi:MAG: hypothetical protein ACI9W4_001119 [Rhodothermales bacterium]|jgi:hypothetical protein
MGRRGKSGASGSTRGLRLSDGPLPVVPESGSTHWPRAPIRRQTRGHSLPSLSARRQGGGKWLLDRRKARPLKRDRAFLVCTGRQWFEPEVLEFLKRYELFSARSVPRHFRDQHLEIALSITAVTVSPIAMTPATSRSLEQVRICGASGSTENTQIPRCVGGRDLKTDPI